MCLYLADIFLQPFVNAVGAITRQRLNPGFLGLKVQVSRKTQKRSARGKCFNIKIDFLNQMFMHANKISCFLVSRNAV